MTNTLNRYSYSQVNSYFSCPTKWRWNYHRELVPEKTRSFFQIGTLIHEFFDDFYREFPNLDWTTFALRIADLMDSTVITTDDAALYALCTRIMKRYITQWSPAQDRGITVLATEFIVEERMTTPMGREFIFEGYVDLMFQRAGQVFLVDHKTSAATRFWSDKEYETLPQLALYQAILQRRGMQVDRLLYNHVNTYNYADYFAQPLEKVFKRKTLIRGTTEIESILRNFCVAVDEIESRREHIQFGHPLHVVKNYGSNCKSCAYHDLCVLEMKGISTENTVRTHFKKKEPRPTNPSGLTVMEFDDEADSN